MSTHVVRAWKDPRYRALLSPDERSRLPHHPAGLVEVADAALDVTGAGDPYCNTQAGCTFGDYCTLDFCTSFEQIVCIDY